VRYRFEGDEACPQAPSPRRVRLPSLIQRPERPPRAAAMAPPGNSEPAAPVTHHTSGDRSRYVFCAHLELMTALTWAKEVAGAHAADWHGGRLFSDWRCEQPQLGSAGHRLEYEG
jgi:hypothetical protein